MFGFWNLSFQQIETGFSFALTISLSSSHHKNLTGAFTVILRKYDLNPFWTKENNTETSSLVVVNRSFRADNVILGATQSNCKLPCTTHSYTTKQIMKIVMKDQDLNWIDLMPSDKIEVSYIQRR